MAINRWIITMGCCAIISILLEPPRISVAATIEVESDDDALSAPPTPSFTKTSAVQEVISTPVIPQKETKPLPISKAITPKSSLTNEPEPTSQNNTRINDNIGFYQFVKSGYMVRDINQAPGIGRVIGGIGIDQNYSTGKKTFVKLYSDRYDVKPDDLFVVYRILEMPITNEKSETLGYVVQNLAIVKAVEVEKRKCFVQVNQSFDTFQKGDFIRPYEDEIKRWKWAQTKKALPNRPIHCFVVGGESGMNLYSLYHNLILSAGTQKGVVEGQVFQLKEPKSSSDGILHLPVGATEVIFAGSNYSIAQIISSSEIIEKGCEAFYEP